MLPGGLCNTAPMDTIKTPGSSCDWRTFGEHVSRLEIFDTDQGSQFTSADFIGMLREAEVRISMDGRGR